jgi:hypothetical protein
MKLDRDTFTEVFMIPASTLSAATSGGITWSKISCGRRYELRRNGEVWGTLVRPSLWSQTFHAETSHDRWTLRANGFFRTGTEILDSTGQAVAQFTRTWGGPGTLTFTDGQTFYLKNRGWWRPVWSLTTDSGQLVLQLHMREKIVEVPASGVSGSRLSLLIVFALYRVQQAEEEAASAAIVAVAG